MRSIALLQDAAATASGATALGPGAFASHSSAAVLAPDPNTTVRNTTGNNVITLGYAGISVAAFSALSNISDKRDKTDISGLKYNALNFINALSPANYRMDFRSDYVYSTAMQVTFFVWRFSLYLLTAEKNS